MFDPVEIAVAVVEHQQRFLVRRRAAGQPLGGLWEFPGGKVEPGETVADAALRECQEETDLAVELVGAYARQTEHYAHGAVTLHFFAARPIGETNDAAGDWKWVSRESLAELEFPSGNRRLIEHLLASLPPADV